MDTQLAFAFGMLVMVVIATVITIVIGLLRVIRHEAGFRNIHNEINDCHRHMSDVERNMYSELNETRNRFDRYTEEFKRELMAYTDSRIDKALGTTKKQILKD